MMDTINEESIPINRVTNSNEVKAKPNFNILSKLAPNITGIARKKVNSVATNLDVPISIAPIIVAPDLDVPGSNDSTWKIPIIIAVLYVKSFKLFIFASLFLFLISIIINNIPYTISIIAIEIGVPKCASKKSSNSTPIITAGIHATITFFHKSIVSFFSSLLFLEDSGFSLLKYSIKTANIAPNCIQRTFL